MSDKSANNNEEAKVGIDIQRLVRCSEDLMHAARRVRNKYGRGNDDTLLNWTEWTDVDDAANSIEKILSERITDGATTADNGWAGFGRPLPLNGE